MANGSIQITSHDGLTFDAYVSNPSSPRGGAVVVIQEIFGVNQGIREICDWLAGEGYIAVAPDIFHRQEKNVQLTDETESGWKRAFELYEGFNEDLGAKDLSTTVEVARKLPGCNGQVGTIGFCLGGKMSFLMSTRSQAEANVGYYGVAIEKNLDEPVLHPLMLHMGTKDKFVPLDVQKQIQEHLLDNPLVTIHSYDGRDHAFCRVGGDHYDKAACDEAHGRTLSFLRHHLG